MLLPTLRRLAEMLFVMLGISIVVFLIFFATPGSDPAARIAGRNATPETLAQVRHSFGLDQPLPIQYLRVMEKLFVSRDLTSFVNRGQKVIPAVIEATPVTLSLVLGAAVIWVIFGIWVGVTAAATRGTVIDRALMFAGLVGVSMPVFWVGSVANLITQSRFHDTWLFHWVPGLGYTPITQNPWLWFKSLVIPWITLAILYIGLYGRVLRANLVEAYQEDFIRTARAKGLSETRIMFRHALRTSLITFVLLRRRRQRDRRHRLCLARPESARCPLTCPLHPQAGPPPRPRPPIRCSRCAISASPSARNAASSVSWRMSPSPSARGRSSASSASRVRGRA
jgi:peptide/nickel transport system permease protein